MSDQASPSVPTQGIQPLTSFATGQDVVITGFAGGRKLQGRLLAMGLFPGQHLTVCQNNGSSLVVSLNGAKIALGCGVSQKILAVAAGQCRRWEKPCCCPLQDDGRPS